MLRIRDLIKDNTEDEVDLISKEVDSGNVHPKDSWFWNHVKSKVPDPEKMPWTLSPLFFIGANIDLTKLQIQMIPDTLLVHFVNNYVSTSIPIAFNMMFRGLKIRLMETGMTPNIQTAFDYISSRTNFNVMLPEIIESKDEIYMLDEVMQNLILQSEPETIVKLYASSTTARNIINNSTTLELLKKEYKIEEWLEIYSFEEFLEILTLKYSYDLGYCATDLFKCIQRMVYMKNYNRIRETLIDGHGSMINTWCKIIIAAYVEGDFELKKKYRDALNLFMEDRGDARCFIYDCLGTLSAKYGDLDTYSNLSWSIQCSSIKHAVFPGSKNILELYMKKRLEIKAFHLINELDHVTIVERESLISILDNIIPNHDLRTNSYEETFMTNVYPLISNEELLKYIPL